ncbi:MAG: hypothetical protein E7Z70_01655 [Thermoplasmata archaeon]|nr:hypothetical protein [Thermoplasmata archaeon]
MIEITVEGDLEECRHAIYQLRLLSDLHISTIYEQCIPSKVRASYYVILDVVGDPRWSLESLPDPDGFFKAVHRYSWGDLE